MAMFEDLFTNTMSCVHLDGTLSDWFISYHLDLLWRSHPQLRGAVQSKI